MEFPLYLPLVSRVSIASIASMKFHQVLIAGATLMLGMSMNACSFLHREKAPSAPMTSSQEFDPYTNSWKTSSRVVTVAPSEPNQALQQEKELKKNENSVMNKAARAGTSVGNTLKKPLGWLPWNKKTEEAAPQ
ncbi:hypothetical protein BH11VER1_BH11VER1_21610 [soil metagenome]